MKRMKAASSARGSAIRRFIAWLALGSAAAGCGRGLTLVMQHYDGPPRPRESLALIRVNGGHGPEVAAIDGEPLRVGSALEPGNRLDVEVLPGVHEVDIEVRDPMTGLDRELSVRFVAESGRVYRVDLVAGAEDAGGQPEGMWAAQAYEVGRDSDAKLGIAPAAPAVTPPRPTAHAPAPTAGRDAGATSTDGDADSAN